MAKFERVKDKWRILRKDLYGNVEPEVKLEAITMPVVATNNYYGFICGATSDECSNDMDFSRIEELPAISAGVSYGSKDKMENDHERATKLNKKLVDMGHLTPIESIQLNFFISGISKACGAQISRHRIGQGHVSASRRFKTAGAGFVYPMLDYIERPETAQGIYKDYAKFYEHSFWLYNALRQPSSCWPSDDPKWPFHKDEEDNWEESYTIRKEDARMVLPVSYATERTWWLNVRALRDFFRLRLAADAEWEIRRLAFMMYDLVQPLLPSLFDDFAEELYKIW